jgi:hypothetical protein
VLPCVPLSSSAFHSFDTVFTSPHQIKHPTCAVSGEGDRHLAPLALLLRPNPFAAPINTKCATVPPFSLVPLATSCSRISAGDSFRLASLRQLDPISMLLLALVFIGKHSFEPVRLMLGDDQIAERSVSANRGVAGSKKRQRGRVLYELKRLRRSRMIAKNCVTGSSFRMKQSTSFIVGGGAPE